MSKDNNTSTDLSEPATAEVAVVPRPGAMSLEGLHDSVKVPHHKAGFWKQMAAYFGPGVLVSVAYMDPGNWGTDLQGGAQFKYGLLWVVGLASLMAIFLQIIAARVGIATGRDLAQCCYDWYPKWTRVPNWLMAELAIIACDLAEVLGGAVALLMLFHIPIFWGVIITGVDVLLLLAMQRFGMRTIEAIVLLLVATIGVCYFIEIFVLPQTQPSFLEMGRAMIAPTLTSATMIYVAIGIIGATVMPHVLYLHPALVQSRKFQKDDDSIRKAIRFNTYDVIANLSVAFLINASILVLAVALLASGQSATIVGTLAGQVVMEGFMHWRIKPWVRRLITRSLAIIPTAIYIGIRGANNITDLIVLSQVVLALQLPFAMFPLLHFASSHKRMGKWRLGWFLLIAGWGSASLITAFDFYGLPDAVKQAWQVIKGG